MTTKESTGVRIVTLKELWNIFVHRLWVMILAAAVAAGGLFLINRLTFRSGLFFNGYPVYSAAGQRVRGKLR